MMCHFFVNTRQTKVNNVIQFFLKDKSFNSFSLKIALKRGPKNV